MPTEYTPNDASDELVNRAARDYADQMVYDRESTRWELCYEKRKAVYAAMLARVKADAAAQALKEFIAWSDASPAVTWSGRLGLKERWEHRDDAAYRKKQTDAD